MIKYSVKVKPETEITINSIPIYHHNLFTGDKTIK